MKILHTADWHLNSVLEGKRRRNKDISRSLQQIQAYLIRHEVEVMLIAGDLFRERSRPEQIQEGVEILKTYFLPFIRNGGTVIVISGNHDSEVLFTTLRDALDLSANPEEQNGFNSPGRFYFVPNSRTLRLKDRAGQPVQFLLMPYPTTRYLLGEEQLSFQSIVHRNRSIKETYLAVLQKQLHCLNTQWPTVMVSHIAVRDSMTASSHLLDEESDVIVDVGDLPTSLAYIALGHLHHPHEPLANTPSIQYAGSIERMDYGERDDRKSVVCLEVTGGGLVGSPNVLPLQSTSFYEVEITDLETQMPLFATQYPDVQQALVRYILHWDSLTQSREDLLRRIEEFFPRWYDRKVIDIRTDSVTEAGLELHQAQDIVGTTRHYLQMQLDGKEHAEDLLQLAEMLFAELEQEGVQ